MAVNNIPTLQDFKNTISSPTPTVVMFDDSVMGSAKHIAPEYEKAASEGGYGGVSFYKLDIRKVEGIRDEVQIRGLPTFMLFKSGGTVQEVTTSNPDRLRELLGHAASVA